MQTYKLQSDNDTIPFKVLVFPYKIMLMPPQQYNQYDFIMNAPKQQRGPKVSGIKSRVLLVIIGLIVLLIIAVIANKILTAGSSAQAAKMTEVAQAETELIRVASLGIDTAKDRDTLNHAATIKATIQSSQNQTKKLLEKRGVKGKGLTKKLSASKNSKSDDKLEEARRNNRYDETFNTLIDKQLTDYQKTLKAAFGGASKSEKILLEKSSKNAERLKTPKESSAATEE